MSDRPVAEAATYPSDSKQNRWASALAAELESSSPAVTRPQICALDRRVTGIEPFDINRLNTEHADVAVTFWSFMWQVSGSYACCQDKIYR